MFALRALHFAKESYIHYSSVALIDGHAQLFSNMFDQSFYKLCVAQPLYHNPAVIICIIIQAFRQPWTLYTRGNNSDLQLHKFYTTLKISILKVRLVHVAEVHISSLSHNLSKKYPKIVFITYMMWHISR